jgi:hypothetical protein
MNSKFFEDVSGIQAIVCDDPLQGKFGFLLFGKNQDGEEVEVFLQRKVLPSVVVLDVTADEFLREMDKHATHTIYRHDNPKTLKLGFICFSCQNCYQLKVCLLKQSKRSQDIQQFLRDIPSFQGG